MKIINIKAKNFLSIGESGVNIDFSKFGNILVIKGKNLDISPQSSNGAGKSTIIECIVYGLYGKMIKGLTHKDAINKKTKTKLELEVVFEINNDVYKVVRKRKPDSLEFFQIKDAETIHLTRGGASSTQEAIEEVLRLNYETFINVVCFGEHNNHAFLTLKAEDKRKIIENLLSLEKYILYSKKTNQYINKIENEKKVLLKSYEVFSNEKDNLVKKIKFLIDKAYVWESEKQKEIDSLNEKIKLKTKELYKSSDNSELILKYKEAQEKIVQNKNEILKYEESKKTLNSGIENLQKAISKDFQSKQDLEFKIKEINFTIQKINSNISLLNNQNKKLEELNDGVVCNVCYGKINKENYKSVFEHNNSQINEYESKIKSEKDNIDNLNVDVNKFSEKIKELSLKKTKAEEMLSKVNQFCKTKEKEIEELSRIKEPVLNNNEILIKEQISHLEEMKSKKEKENNPYTEIIISTKEELGIKENEITSLKSRINEIDETVPYYEFWSEGFGDKGIRSLIIDNILPALNSRINYWLQFLIDNKIHLEFNKEFDTTITRNPPDGDPFVYSATSGGEKRRINLAISQAFAHIMMLSTGVCPSLISLDEVALNVDLQGIHGIYKMITELSRDRQVIVTTHDSNLQDLLENCDSLTVVKENGFSSIYT